MGKIHQSESRPKKDFCTRLCAPFSACQNSDTWHVPTVDKISPKRLGDWPTFEHVAIGIAYGMAQGTVAAVGLQVTKLTQGSPTLCTTSRSLKPTTFRARVIHTCDTSLTRVMPRVTRIYEHIRGTYTTHLPLGSLGPCFDCAPPKCDTWRYP